jgi:hypothetical protein
LLLSTIVILRRLLNALGLLRGKRRHCASAGDQSDGAGLVGNVGLPRW